MRAPWFLALATCGVVAGVVHAQEPPLVGTPEEVFAAPGVAAEPVGSADEPAVWGRAEYLLWWVRDAHLPPLVTTGSPAAAIPGAFGQPGTAVLLGGSANFEEFSGGRFTVGTWLADDQTLGVEANFFFLGQRSLHYDFASSGTPGSPVLSRPFFDVVGNFQNADLIALPFIDQGGIDVTLSSRLYGAEANLLAGAGGDADTRLSLLGGFRFLALEEDLGITSESVDLPVGTGNTTIISDAFGTRNYFYGGQVGALASVRRGSWSLDLTGKVALGDMHEITTIAGGTRVTSAAGAVTPVPGGLLAQPTNIGHHDRDEFAVVPEVGINLAYQVTDTVRVLAGYSFLYASDVARPADQIDLGVNVTQFAGGVLAGPPRPAFQFHGTDFWAQGVNVGLEFRY